MRLDSYIFSSGHAESREKAAFLIRNGGVSVNGRVVVKPSAKVLDGDVVETRAAGGMRYVGRGGYKLEKALDVFKINLKGKICVDIGASTGGFTDCALQHGAKKVYAIDVGRDQLHQRLKSDARVEDMQGMDIRDARIDEAGADFVMSDVSFISLTHVFPCIKRMMRVGGDAVCLIKPQFEAGPENVKNGVVRNIGCHIRVMKNTVCAALAEGLFLYGLDFSPIRGGAGNIEFIAHFRADVPSEKSFDFNKIAAAAHESFKKGGDCFDSRDSCK